MHPLLSQALADTAVLRAERGWTAPTPVTLDEAGQLLALVLPHWRAPVVQLQPDGTVTFDWDADAHGWLQLALRGAGHLAHSGVIDGDDYEQDEPFDGARLPDWAQALLHRLLQAEH